ncbi:hypothetical protein Taro_003320 [Colocasia esculenta]|uniref:Uncharacterized protein n=1 Tax=Colocasia esculenta TaxID=4460 RepID=A0A843TNH1_COLES|nr:hypothetical protein [Colocasia esculenta]
MDSHMVDEPVRPRMTRTPTRKGMTKSEARSTLESLCYLRVVKFLVAGEQEIIHTKPFFFPVVSAATCTDHHLGVELRARRVSKGSSLAPMTASHKYTVNHGVSLVVLSLALLLLLGLVPLHADLPAAVWGNP